MVENNLVSRKKKGRIRTGNSNSKKVRKECVKEREMGGGHGKLRQKEFFLSLLQTPILHFQPLPRSLFCDSPFYFHFSISCWVKHSVANIPIEIRRKLIPCGEEEHFLFEHVLFLFMPSHFEKRKEKDVEEGEKIALAH